MLKHNRPLTVPAHVRDQVWSRLLNTTPSPSLSARTSLTETRNSREEQRRQIWSGCQTVLGCGGVIAIATIVYSAVGLPLVAAARPGQDVIVFLYPKTAQNAVFWCG